jgi:hypothetical protein
MNAAGSMTTTIREGFFRTNFHTDNRPSFPALWSVLARGFLSRQPASERTVELSEQRLSRGFAQLQIAFSDR